MVTDVSVLLALSLDEDLGEKKVFAEFKDLLISKTCLARLLTIMS